MKAALSFIIAALSLSPYFSYSMKPSTPSSHKELPCHFSCELTKKEIQQMDFQVLFGKLKLLTESFNSLDKRIETTENRLNWRITKDDALRIVQDEVNKIIPAWLAQETETFIQDQEGKTELSRCAIMQEMINIKDEFGSTLEKEIQKLIARITKLEPEL